MTKQDQIATTLTRLHNKFPLIGPCELFDMLWDELDALDITLTRAERIALGDSIEALLQVPILITTMPLTFDGFMIPEGYRFYTTVPTGDGWAVTYLGTPLTVTYDQGVMKTVT